MQPLAMYQKRILKNGIVGCGEGVIFHIFGCINIEISELCYIQYQVYEISIYIFTLHLQE